jgi:hypothetical protein
MSLLDKSPQLVIRRVRVTGRLGCDIRLHAGLNIVKGEVLEQDAATSNNCGKSTFTDLIKYGLGDRDRFSDGEIAKQIDQLLLEISCNGEILTIQRDLNRPTARVHIYEGETSNRPEKSDADYKLSPQTPFSDFLLERLGMPRIMISKSTRAGTNPSPVTFQTYMRLFYMDQVNSFQRILNKVQPEWLGIRMVEILLGLTHEELERLRVKRQELTNQIDDLSRQITNISEFLVKSGDMNRLGVSEAIRENQHMLENVTDEIRDMKQRMRAITTGRAESLRVSINELSQRRAEKSEELAKLRFKMRDFELLRSSLLTDRDKIMKMAEATNILNSVSFSQCPRCLQPITREMTSREEENECMLCARPLRISEHRPAAPKKDEVVDEEIAEVEALIGVYKERIDAIISQIDPDTEDITRLQEELDSITSQYVSPFVDALEQLLYERNTIVGRIHVLEQQLHQWMLLDELEDRLANLRKERGEVDARINSYDSYDAQVVRNFSEFYESFLHRVAGNADDSARMDSKTLMPLINGASYTADVGSGMQSVRTIGYHYSLLEYSIELPSYYPRFLIVDSPRAFDLNQDTYERLLLQFLRLVQKYDPSDFQLILTTRDLPAVMETHVVERLNSKNRMLLRGSADWTQAYLPFA